MLAARRAEPQARGPRQEFMPARRQSSRLTTTVLLGVACASSFSFLLGYDIGIMSGAKRLIKREFSLSEGELELLVAILNLVSGPGGLLSGRLADVLGRRPSAALACVVTLCGALLMATASSYSILLIGRVITGLGVGCCFHVAPLYLTEISPKHVRGKLVSSFDLFINIGILVGYGVGYALTPDPSDAASSGASAWRVMLGIGAVPPALILIGLIWLPESPRYLVSAGREREAREVLSRIYSSEEAIATIEVLRGERRDSKPLSLCAGLRRVFLPAKGAPRAMILAGLGCAFWQQATGVEAAVYYTPETLEAAGITDEGQLLLATVGIGGVKVVFIIVAACLVERLGRVQLLLISTAGIGFSQLLLGLSFSLGRVVPLALTGQALFMAAFSIGAGPCSMMVASEIFPLQAMPRRIPPRARDASHIPRPAYDLKAYNLPFANLAGARLCPRRRDARQPRHLGHRRPLIPLPLALALARGRVLPLCWLGGVRVRLHPSEGSRDQGPIARGDRVLDGEPLQLPLRAPCRRARQRCHDRLGGDRRRAVAWSCRSASWSRSRRTSLTQMSQGKAWQGNLAPCACLVYLSYSMSYSLRKRSAVYKMCV